MISDSYYWKEALLASANWLPRVRYSERRCDERMFKIERELFFGFYSIRKLCDTFKLSDETKTMLVRVDAHPQKKVVNYLNADQVGRLYDLQTRDERQVPLTFICNQFVHSYVFSAVWNGNNGLHSFLVSSDRKRQKEVYSISLSQVNQVFRKVARDYPNRITMTRDPKTSQFTCQAITLK